MLAQKASNVYWHEQLVDREAREQFLNQRGAVIWMTGLPSSGKSTVANELASHLHRRGNLAYVLDGDNIRHGLNRDLGFSPGDREENIRRISEVANLFADAGLIAITAFVSPYRKDRQYCRTLAGPDRFVEVYVHASLDVCEKRDPKGLYKKAKKGELPQFTGISAPYEEPLSPEITLRTEKMALKEEVDTVIRNLMEKGILYKS